MASKALSTQRRILELVVVDSNPIWGSDFFCVLLWLTLYISLYFFHEGNYKTKCENERHLHIIIGRRQQKLKMNELFSDLVELIPIRWKCLMSLELIYWGLHTSFERERIFPSISISSRVSYYAIAVVMMLAWHFSNKNPFAINV